MSYAFLDSFFSGDYLEIRKPQVLGCIKAHCDLTNSSLLNYLNSATLKDDTRAKILAYMSDMDEVYFMAENLHMFVQGMSKITSTPEVLHNKTIEIKNQGQWIARHLPAMWDGSIILTRYKLVIDDALLVIPEINTSYFESDRTAKLICRTPFSFLKLLEVSQAQQVTKAMMAGILAVSVSDVNNDQLEVSRAQAAELGVVQAYYYDTLYLTIRNLIVEYERAALAASAMSESDECLRLIDLLENSIRALRKEYNSVMTKWKTTPPPPSTPGVVDVDKFKANVERVYSNMQELLRKRLGRGSEQ